MQKYCDRICKRAAYLKLTREDVLAIRLENEKQSREARRRAGEAGYGNCVIFRDDGGYNRQYLAADGTWTVDREEAARCLGIYEAEELAKAYGVVFFGGPSRAYPARDILYFRNPSDYSEWLADNWGEIDAVSAEATERLIQADLRSASPFENARAILRAGIAAESRGANGEG